MMRYSLLASVAAACIVAGGAGSATAQDTAAAPVIAAPADAAPADTTSASASAQTGVGDIVVTAQKRSESAQRIPVSVAAIAGTQLAQQGVKDLFQAVNLVPGVVFSRAPDDGLALTFRGLGTTARPQAFEQSVALFTDGVFFGKGRLYSTAFFDVDRLEFIKGTQSTLLGKNASIGAISIVTRQPGDTFGVEARAGYEFEHGGYTVDAAGDVPLADKVSLRVAGHYNDLNGWVRNDFTGQKGPEHIDEGLRATLKARPTDALTITAFYQYGNNRQYGTNYQIVGPIPAFYGDGVLDGHTTQFTSRTDNGDTFHRTVSHVASVKGELELGQHLLVAQTSYVAYKLKFIDDFDFSRDDAINFLRDEKYRQFTQELRIQSPTGNSLEYMAGLFFLDSHWNSIETQDWEVPGFPPAGDPPPGQLFNGPFTNSFKQHSRAYSAFASGTWHITGALRLAGGLRYTREEKDAVYGRVALPPFTVWNTIANPPFDPTPLGHNADFVDGNVSLEYDVAPHVMAYGSFGHGSKAGGYAETNTIAVPPTALVNGKVPPALVKTGAGIRDEFTKSYEIGVKSTLFGGRVRLNVAGFLTNIKDFQDTVFTGGTLGFITFNGPAKSRGFEIESAFQATHNLRFDGGLTYTDATTIIQPINLTTNAPATDADGNAVFGKYRRAQAPKIIFNAGTNYTLRLSDAMNVDLSASVRHRSSMFNQRQELFPSHALTTVDLSAGIETADKRWGVDVVAKNVNNARSQDFASPSVDPRFSAYYGAYLAGPNPSRTITLSVHTKF